MKPQTIIYFNKENFYYVDNFTLIQTKVFYAAIKTHGTILVLL
jgi:hypothetical protein